MLRIMVVKSASATMVGLLGIAMFAGFARAETVAPETAVQTSEVNNVVEVNNASSTYIDIRNETTQSSQASAAINDSVAAEANTSSINSNDSASVNSVISDSNVAQSQNENSSGVIASSKDLPVGNLVVQNTTKLSTQNTELPLSAISQRIIDNTYAAQNNSSFVGPQPISRAVSTAPVSPAIPVEPQTPVGLLQQLSLILSQSPAGGFAGAIPQPDIYLPVVAFLLILILSSFAAAKSASLFVQFLRNSGYSGAARSDVIATSSLFATPLKMSFITVRVH